MTPHTFIVDSNALYVLILITWIIFWCATNSRYIRKRYKQRVSLVNPENSIYLREIHMREIILHVVNIIVSLSYVGISTSIMNLQQNYLLVLIVSVICYFPLIFMVLYGFFNDNTYVLYTATTIIIITIILDIILLIEIPLHVYYYDALLINVILKCSFVLFMLCMLFCLVTVSI